MESLPAFLERNQRFIEERDKKLESVREAEKKEREAKELASRQPNRSFTPTDNRHSGKIEDRLLNYGSFYNQRKQEQQQQKAKEIAENDLKTSNVRYRSTNNLRNDILWAN